MESRGPMRFRQARLEAAGVCGGRWLWELNAAFELRYFIGE
jgi:hypothetical protein